jgi:hypothetical protein
MRIFNAWRLIVGVHPALWRGRCDIVLADHFSSWSVMAMMAVALSPELPPEDKM